eukprot:TRINITY_DN91494_c0_g1_i1.p1 TRINITY_DN91494_c0_g1~~TRINITY_DN91494_c0_g1_i1.p1  ORF type:complete len:433 (+),score=71.00 TRINITY_DN91494_c0_g1_i1:82-1299(+)
MKRTLGLAAVVGTAVVATAVRPVVIVPGDGSNQLEAKIDKPETVKWFCHKKSDWFRLWLSTSDLLGATSCWADNIKLIYDEQRDELTNNVGVETRVPYWGTTDGFEELDPKVPFHGSAVFRDMVAKLVSLGHTKNVTLRGAPYDFRYAPSSAVGKDFIQKLKSLIEETYEAQGQQRVSLISHSMGCLQTLYLLSQADQAWKDKHIEKWIPLGGPFGGSASEMRLHASGDSFGLPISPSYVREEQRSYETNFWLAPVPQWFEDRTLVISPTRNYTAQDYDTFFDDIGYPLGKTLLKRVLPLTASVPAPGVDVVCMYSTGVKTSEMFKYGDSFDEAPEVIMGDGDGTVNEWSLKLCERWTAAGAQDRAASTRVFQGVEHQKMLTDEKVLKEVMRELGLAGETAPVVV